MSYSRQFITTIAQRTNRDYQDFKIRHDPSTMTTYLDVRFSSDIYLSIPLAAEHLASPSVLLDHLRLHYPELFI